MANNLSQEEIELLMNGSLSEERSKEAFGEDIEQQPKEILGEGNIDELFAEEVTETVQEEKTGQKLEQSTSKQKLKAEKIALRKKQKQEKIALNQSKKKEKKIDTEVSDQNVVPQKTNKVIEKLNNISMKTLKIILISMTALVVVVIILLMFVIYQNNKLQAANKISVTVPNYKANTTNYIFISQEKDFNDSKLKLVKMLIDPVATVFYFDKPLDFMSYEAELKDKNGRNYNMDLSFAETSNNDNTELSSIRFETLESGIKEFTLTILDPYTGEKVDYTVKLDSYPKLFPAKYLSSAVKTQDSNSDFEIVVEDAIFSSSGSIIQYRINWKDNSETIQLGWKDTNPNEFITLEEKNIIIPATKDYPSMYSFPNNNTVLGRMDFETVKNLNSNINIKFNSLYRQNSVNQKIDLTSLPYIHSEETQKEIICGNYKVVLEKFADNEGYCIVTYHVNDMNNNLVETKLDGELIIGDSSGMEVVIDGKSMSKTEGGDFVFNTKKATDIINKLKDKKYTLNLKSIGIKIPNQTVSLELSQLDDSVVQTDKKEVENFVLESFKKRLAAKSGEIPISELNNYFEPYVLEKDEIIRDYLHPTTIVEPAQYSSQVLTMAKNGEEYYAIVQDAWKGNEGVKEIHFYRTHKVIVKNINNVWKITEDTIVK